MVRPDESHLSRREILRLAGLAAGAATLPAACHSLSNPSEVANSAAEAANPAKAPNTGKSVASF
ncbi:hypothetical protein H6F89_33565 [Cyanobacteria bacterium FACHB-63]|nr:hypothetical protein [Cyanobacteria bacterium FACHB-63]